jgi:hypothetical protein
MCGEECLIICQIRCAVSLNHQCMARDVKVRKVCPTIKKVLHMSPTLFLSSLTENGWAESIVSRGVDATKR